MEEVKQGGEAEQEVPQVTVRSVISRIPELSAPEQVMGAQEEQPTDGAAAAGSEEDDARSESEPTEEDKGKEAPGEEPHPKSKEGRIAKLTREKHEERRRRESLEKELTDLKTRIAAVESRPPPAPEEKKEPLKRPKMEEFIGDDGELDEAKYDAALEAYDDQRLEAKLAAREAAKTEKAKTEEQQTQVQQQQEEARKQVEQAFAVFDDRAAAYAKESGTFEDAQATVNAMLTDAKAVSDQNPLGFVSQTAAVVGEILLKSEMGPAVIDFLGQNAEEAESIVGMEPVLAAVKIGNIIQRLSDGGRTPMRKVKSNAPTPPPKVSSARGKSTVDPADLANDPAAYAEAMGLNSQGYR